MRSGSRPFATRKSRPISNTVDYPPHPILLTINARLSVIGIDRAQARMVAAQSAAQAASEAQRDSVALIHTQLGDVEHAIGLTIDHISALQGVSDGISGSAQTIAEMAENI